MVTTWFLLDSRLGRNSLGEQDAAESGEASLSCTPLFVKDILHPSQKNWFWCARIKFPIQETTDWSHTVFVNFNTKGIQAWQITACHIWKTRDRPHAPHCVKRSCDRAAMGLTVSSSERGILDKKCKKWEKSACDNSRHPLLYTNHVSTSEIFFA